MISLRKTLLRACPIVVAAGLMTVTSGCKWLSTQYSNAPTPYMQSAPSPYSFPKNGGYTIADPMPDMALPPLPPPGHSIPLNPSPQSAPPPPSELSPVPPAPGNPVNSRDTTGDSLSRRIRSKLNPARNSQNSVAQSSNRRSDDPYIPSGSDASSQLGAPRPLAPGHSEVGGIRTPPLKSVPFPVTTPDQGADANGSPPNASQIDQVPQSPVQPQRYSAEATGSNRNGRSRRRSTSDDLDSRDNVPAIVPAPQSSTGGATVPVMLPPGA